ncbi:MAG: hypothetical protein F6K54_09650 [Okeania sp. SIO3B5]|uniref:hypothetical protein n=1 Tax=Okeania sp. SIO3B5 TaxID=2607811 RepID=UPI0013FF04DD|nr:hypothetical protein [Okeania sp. SIO3B5]NEO53320.1 hypothetical protein [Okeania sp. SIO3B5]
MNELLDRQQQDDLICWIENSGLCKTSKSRQTFVIEINLRPEDHEFDGREHDFVVYLIYKLVQARNEEAIQLILKKLEQNLPPHYHQEIRNLLPVGRVINLREYQPGQPEPQSAYFVDSQVFQLMPLDIGTIWGLQRSSFIGILISFEEAKIYENLKNVEFLLSDTIANKEKNSSGIVLPKREWIWLDTDNYNPPSEKYQIIDAVVNPTQELDNILNENPSPDSTSIPGFFLEIKAKKLNTNDSNYSNKIQEWCKALLNELFPSQSVAIVINIVSSIEVNIDKSVKNLKAKLEKIAEEKPIELMRLDYRLFFNNKSSETTNDTKSKNKPGLAFCSWMYNFRNSSLPQEILQGQNSNYQNIMKLYETLREKYSEKKLKNAYEKITPNNVILDIQESTSQDLPKIYEQLLKIIVIYSGESSLTWINACVKSKIGEAVRAALKIATDDDFIFLSDILMDGWVDAINLDDLDLLYKNGAFTSDFDKSNNPKLESLFLALLRKENEENSSDEKVKTMIQKLSNSLLLQELYDFYKNPTEKENDFLDLDYADWFTLAIRANIKFEQVINKLKTTPVSDTFIIRIYWLLATITPTKENIIELLQLEPIKRAILGLCTHQEWQNIQNNSNRNRKRLINDCRRDRPLIF